MIEFSACRVNSSSSARRRMAACTDGNIRVSRRRQRIWGAVPRARRIAPGSRPDHRGVQSAGAQQCMEQASSRFASLSDAKL